MVNKVPKQGLKMNNFQFGCWLSQWQTSCDLLPAALLRCLLMLAGINDCQFSLLIYLTASCINQISFTLNVLSINLSCLPNFLISHWAAQLPDTGEPLETHSMPIHCCRQKIGHTGAFTIVVLLVQVRERGQHHTRLMQWHLTYNLPGSKMMSWNFRLCPDICLDCPSSFLWIRKINYFSTGQKANLCCFRLLCGAFPLSENMNF